MNQNAPDDLTSANTAVVSAPEDKTAEVAGCWSNVGVYGNASCPELHQFVHCRNCPVYSAAGAKLLDRLLPLNYRRDWSQHFAEDKRLPEAGNSSAILFRIQSEWLALPTRSFQDVAEKRPIHSLPRRSSAQGIGAASLTVQRRAR